MATRIEVSVPSQNNLLQKEVTTNGTQGKTDPRKEKAISIVPVPSTTAADLDTRIALIQALIPVALEKVRMTEIAVNRGDQGWNALERAAG